MIRPPQDTDGHRPAARASRRPPAAPRTGGGTVTPAPPPSAWTAWGDRLILPGLLGFTRLGYRWQRRHWAPLNVSLDGRTAVVTGATSGLGLATAQGLARLGARVVLVGRNGAKVTAAQTAIRKEVAGAQVVVAVADLARMQDVRRLAGELLATEPRIDILVNNAGVLLPERTLTADGLEATLATNLLAPFLLTQMLLPRLVASAPARIINVASGGMYTSGLDVDDLPYERKRWNGPDAYARTKRALVVLTELWAERLKATGVVVHTMHPGWADTPGVATSLPGFHALTRPWLRTADEGADTIVWLAAAPEAGACTGGFWLDRKLHPTTVFPGTDVAPEQRRRLWDTLIELTKAPECPP